MAVKLNDKTKPGDLYIDKQAKVSELFSFYTNPSAIIKNIVSGERTVGAIGSPNLEDFKKIEELDKAELLIVLSHLVSALIDKRDKIQELLDKVDYLQIRIGNLQNEILELTNEDSNN